MLAFLLFLSLPPPFIRAFQLQFQCSLATKAGVPRAGGPQECQPLLSLVFRPPHLPAQLAVGPCKRQWFGGGPAFSVACEMGSLHKEFPNKRHQYYLWSHQTAWSTIWLWLSHTLPLQVLCKGLVGTSQTQHGPECQYIGRSPSSSPLCYTVSPQTQFIQVGQWVDS